MPVKNLVVYITLPILMLCMLVLSNPSVHSMAHRKEQKLYLWANDLSRKPDDPAYLSIYYRFRKMYFSLAPHSEHQIVFLGDSMTDEGDWSKLFPDLPVINRGIGGDTTLGVLNRLDQVIALQPSQIFLMIGTNDLCFNSSIPDTMTNYRKILNRLHNELPDTKIYIQSVLPFNETIFPSRALRTNGNIKQLNVQIEKLAHEYNYPYIDLTPALTGSDGRLPSNYTVDGLHLNDSGYLLWREQIKDII